MYKINIFKYLLLTTNVVTDMDTMNNYVIDNVAKVHSANYLDSYYNNNVFCEK